MFESLIFFFVLLVALVFVVLVLTRSIHFPRKPAEQQRSETTAIPQEQPIDRGTEALPKATEEYLVKAIVTQRIEAVKNRDAQSIASLIDVDSYSKYDDWPPLELQLGSAVLRNEADALKVLKEYSYEASDWRVSVFEDAAIASFNIHYQGKIRDMDFNIRSRVSVVLLKKVNDWKIVHEHWSRISQS